VRCAKLGLLELFVAEDHHRFQYIKSSKVLVFVQCMRIRKQGSETCSMKAKPRKKRTSLLSNPTQFSMKLFLAFDSGPALAAQSDQLPCHDEAMTQLSSLTLSSQPLSNKLKPSLSRWLAVQGSAAAEEVATPC